MATRDNDGRLTKIIYLLHPQKPLLDARILEISRTLCQVMAHFVPNFVPIATRVSRAKNLIGSICWPIPKTTPFINVKISQISLMHAEL